MFGAFIAALSANLATKFLTFLGKEKTDDIKASLDNAFVEGLKHFTNSINDEDVDKEYIEKLLKDEAVESLFIDIVKDPSLLEDPARIEQTLEGAGIDVGTIEGFDLKAAATAFLRGFESCAESSEKLVPFLELQLMKRILNSLEERMPDLDLLKRKYFNYIKEKFGQMSFKGLSEGKLISFPLKDLYTRLTITDELPKDKMEHLRKRESMDRLEFIERTKDSNVNISDIINSQYSVITGGPGSGKSTLLKYIALAFVEGKEKDRLGWMQHDVGNVSQTFSVPQKHKRSLLPILFPISAYAEDRKKTGHHISLKEYIPSFFKGQGLPDLSPLFEKALRDNNAIVLFDGLDEVADETERRKMVSDIRNFMLNDNSSNNIFIVTCRTASYTRTSRFEKLMDKEFSHYTILPFGEDVIGSFLSNWYLLYEREINKRIETAEVEADKKQKKMISVISKNRNIFDLATNPLMLTILALIEHEGGELPRNRADLYGRCLRMLSGAWEKLRNIYEAEDSDFKLGGRKISEDLVIDFLGPIAYEMHEKAIPNIEYEELKNKLAEKFDLRNKDMFLSKEQADEFIQIMKERSGILQEVSPGTYGFMHLTFKEYLSARNLTDLCDDRIKQLGHKLFKPEWREVVLLAFSVLRKTEAGNFIRDIISKNVEHFKNIILAGECVLDASRDKIDDKLYDDLIELMVNAMDSNAAVEDIVSVGETLGWLGDPRDLKEFVKIPGGKYELKNGAVDVQAFEIGKYPVTNSWFEEFVKASGYKNRDLWSEEGRKWLEYTKAENPKLWNDRKWKCPNLPVVGVSWYEAYAFTKWLTLEQKRYEYRLLNENEWEAAASGHDDREYPWGKEWDKNQCNNGKIDINKTSPVGVFKGGNTPDGVSDLSGNVWEWTASDYHSKKYVNDFFFDDEMQKLFDENKIDEYVSKLSEKNRESPVLRGGSWGDETRNCRCAVSYYFNPVFRYSDVGFRCARTLTL